MKRTLSLLLALVMVVSMIPTVFATTDDTVDFDDLFYVELDECSPIVTDIAANDVAGFVWTATGEGTLTYEVPENYVMTLTQGEQTVTGTGTVTMDVVADEAVYIEVENTTAEAVEALTIEGTFGAAVCEHVAGDPVVEDLVEATCTAPGSYNSVVYCAECGEKLSSTAVETPVVEHAWDEGVFHEATTERNAYTLYTCGACGATKEVEEEGTQLPPEVTFAITTHPTDQHNKLGETATFTVVAEGAVSYQWQRIKSGATTWSNISGATAASYSVKVSSSSVIPYRCIVKDAEGNELITEDVTIILPDPLVTILNTPGNIHVVKNTSISFTVELDNEEGVTYQWQRCKNGVNWTNVSYKGSNTKTVTFDAASWAQFPFRCEITDANGTKIYAETYTYTLYEPPIAPAITSNPKNANIYVSGTATFTVVAQGSSFVDDGSENTGVTYQWWRSRDDGATWGQYNGDGGQTASISIKVYSGQDYLYMCEVKDGYGNTMKSTSAKPVFVEPIVITAQPTATLGDDGKATFTFTMTGDVKTIMWQSLKNGAWQNATGDNYEGYNTTTLVTSVNRSYRCKILDMTGAEYYTDVIAFPTAQ